MKLQEQLKRYKLKVVKKNVMMYLDELHIQHIPMVRPERWWNGYDQMALRTSPHVELLRLYVDYGLKWDLIERTPYWLERRARRTEHGRKNWTDKWIREHIKVRIRTYKMLKKHGFKKKYCKDNPILVLEQPFWKTRFNWKDDSIKGPEIVDGAGRCSAAFVLGIEKLPVTIVKDAAPGSMKCKPIQGKFRVVWTG